MRLERYCSGVDTLPWEREGRDPGYERTEREVLMIDLPVGLHRLEGFATGLDHPEGLAQTASSTLGARPGKSISSTVTEVSQRSRRQGDSTSAFARTR